MYQGRLLNSNSVPVSDASAAVSFALYNESSSAIGGDACIWSNNSNTCASIVARTVTLTAGLFSESLGDTAAGVPYAAIPATIFANDGTVYLQVVVNGETLLPRKQMLAAPYAMNSDVVDGYDTTTTGATSSMIPVTDSNGNIVITGAPTGSGVNQGSIYINPATGVVAANEVLLGIAVSGVSKFTLDGEGDSLFAGNVDANNGLDVTNSNLTVGGVNFSVIPASGDISTAGDLALNGGDLNSTGPITITSGGAGNIVFDPASGLAYIATNKDLAVGGSSLAGSSFSVDSSENAFRFGTGTGTNAALNLFSLDGDTGELSYRDDDTLYYSGGFFQVNGPNVLPANILEELSAARVITTLSGTSGANLQKILNTGLLSRITYTGAEGIGTTEQSISGMHGALTLSGASTVLTNGTGTFGFVQNTSGNVALLEIGGSISGIRGLSKQSALPGSVLSDARGVTGEVDPDSATITNAYGLYGRIKSGVGAITTSYGAYALNTASGLTRYGIFSQASGGATNNFSGYFTGSKVQIDADALADTPVISTTAGELYVSGDVESRGSFLLGDLVGIDTFNVSSAATNETIGQFIGDKLTGGVGLRVSHADDGVLDFTGSLMLVDQLDSGGTSAGSALKINQQGTGNAIGLNIVQNTTSPHSSSNGTGNNVLVMDVLEDATTDDAIILRSDADNSNGVRDIEFRVTSEGNAYVDGAFTGGGADFAEYFVSNDAALSEQYLACQDGSTAGAVKRCEVGNTQIVGVISTNPAFIGNNTGDGTEEMRGNTHYRLVGLVGQIDTKVSTSNGAIAVGDPISTSSTLAGYGAKAHGPVRIAGFALDALSSGTGTIRVLVSPQWYGGDALTATGSATQVSGSFAIASSTAATASSTAVDSGTLSLRGSVWSSGSAQAIGMSMKTVVSAVNDYKLSVTNNAGTEVASVGNTGDFAIAGRLYPSDRGAMQKSKYIYYDGSSGSGGDFMRTNAAGWSTGSYDFAEMFPSPDALIAGEVVMFGDASQQVKRTTGETYNRKIAGIVSTRPGFLAGENTRGNYPIALAGRVPTLVSTENGAINIGDPLTTSTHPGYAMKATEAGPILGYAADSFSGSMGTVVVYVNVSYYSGAPVAQGPAATNTISQLALDIQHFDTTGTLNFNGGRLLAVGSMTSASGTWKLESNGDLVTSGRLIELVRSATGVDVETYAATTRQMTVQLSGSVVLDHGHANVKFADIDPSFVSVIDTNPTYRALVTPYGATGALYVTNRTIDGFTITESGAASTGVSVDWLVIASRRDYAPIPATVSPIVAADPIVPAPSVDSVPATSPSVEASSDPVVIAPDVSSTDVPIVDAAISNDATASDPSINASSDPVPSNSVSDTVEASSGADTSVTP